MNSKSNRTKNQVNLKNSVSDIQKQNEMVKKAQEILQELKSYTWRDLETKGKFSKNDKITFISDDMLILG